MWLRITSRIRPKSSIWTVCNKERGNKVPILVQNVIERIRTDVCDEEPRTGRFCRFFVLFFFKNSSRGEEQRMHINNWLIFIINKFFVWIFSSSICRAISTSTARGSTHFRVLGARETKADARFFRKNREKEETRPAGARTLVYHFAHFRTGSKGTIRSTIILFYLILVNIRRCTFVV